MSDSCRPRRGAPRRGPARVALVLACAAGGCTDPAAVQMGSTIEIVVEGRAERGLPLVAYALTAAGEALPAGAVAWSVRPADAGRWSADTLRLASTGPIEIRAEHEGRTAIHKLEVAAPPVILFDMAVDGNRDLYRAALDGGELERLTTHPAADSDPTVAAGGIVFVSDRDGNRELYAMPLSGGAEVRLTRTAENEAHPALSPDGTRLAFARGSGLTRIYVAAPDASAATRPDPAHGHDGTLENAPAWSPDGQRLAFASTAAGTPDLYLWDGAATTALAASPGGNFEPAWSPDGRRIAFASGRSGDVELYLLDVENRELQRLTERTGSDGFPAWLPDGRIVYVAYVDGRPELRWLDPAAPAETHAIPLPGQPGNPTALPR